MFLYELALEMGVRSPDLVERAAALGLAGVGPSSELTAVQVASLRSGVPAPPPPPSRPDPPTGPGTDSQADAPWRTARDGPVSWASTHSAPDDGSSGPPWPAQSSLAPPPGWTPGAGGAPPPGLAGTGVPSPPPDAKPERWSQWVAVGVLAPLIVVLFAFMFVNSGPDERRQKAIAERADAAAVATTRPDIAGGLGGGPTDVEPKTERGAGRGEEPRVPEEGACPEEPAAVSGGQIRPLAAGRFAVDDCGPDAEGGGGTTPTAPPNPSGGPVPGLPPTRTVDRYAFCAAAQGFAAFELELAAAVLRRDGGGVRTVILTGRDRWRTDIDAMAAAGRPTSRVTSASTRSGTRRSSTP